MGGRKPEAKDTSARRSRGRGAGARGAQIVRDLLADAAGLVSWTVHPDGRLEMNGGRLNLMAALPKSIPDVLAHMHPDEAQAVDATISRALREGGKGAFDCRFRAKTGEWAHIHITFQAERAARNRYRVHLLSQDITAQIAERERAFETTERLRIALGAARAGVCEIDFVRGQVWCPESATRLLGRELTFPADGEEPWPMCHPDDRGKVLAAPWIGDLHEPIELRVIHPDGQIRWIELHGERQLGPDGRLAKIIALILDIDARKRQELALIEARQEAQAAATRLKVAMDAARAGVFETDFVTRTFWCSPEFAEIAGRRLTFEEAAGPWPNIHPDDVEVVWRSVVDSQAVRGPAHAEWRVQLPSGEYRWIEVYGLAQYGEDPQPLRLTGVALDIDARKRQELALVDAQRSAEAAAEAKAQFLANMSHEIRTPMNGVLGVLHLLEKEPLSEDGRRLREEAERCGHSLAQLLNDVIDFSRIEAGRLELSPEALEPKAVLASVIDILRPMAEVKGVALTAVAEGDPGWIEADPVRLRQALFNLVGNAVKFTEQGKVEARLEVLAPEAGPRRLRFEITDTGVGIPKAAQAELFQRFTQADGSTSRRFGGSGLGLAITRRLIELMDGDIGFESVEGRGSRFWFDIPAPAAAPPEAQEAGPQAGLDGVRILLVEDNPTNRLVAAKILESLGAEVETAEDGVEGVRAVQARAYDLVLMDMQMPRMDGLEATRRIRALEGPARRAPIVAMTANVLSHQRASYLSCGMNGVVAKPISPALLVAEIASAIAEAKAENELRHKRAG
jgi:signal transduction histidine kinase/AmiR/NasT family two-component response regulator